jgi:hypothetical protein
LKPAFEKPLGGESPGINFFISLPAVVAAFLIASQNLGGFRLCADPNDRLVARALASQQVAAIAHRIVISA